MSERDSIKVKLFGGAKKSFMRDAVAIDADSITVAGILEHLARNKPAGTAPLDAENVLIAINGADSSVLGGRSAVATRGDTVSIIPVIHGGSDMRFALEGRSVEVFCMRSREGLDRHYIDRLRERYPELMVQGISSEFVLGMSHIQKILYLSVLSERCGSTLARRLEADILARFACTTQISRAIKLAGISSGNDFVLIAMGSASELDRLQAEVGRSIEPGPFSWASQDRLMNQFGIAHECLRAVDSGSPLEDVLVEWAATLS